MPAALPEPIRRVWEDPLELAYALGYHDLCGLHEEMWEHFRQHTRAYCEVPRGHFKSTLLSVVLPIWLLLRNPNDRVMLFNAALSLGRKFLDEIKDRLEGDFAPRGFEDQPQPFSRVFPYMAVERFNSQEGLNIAGRMGTGREMSVHISAVGKGTAGNHPTVIIADDIQNEQNSKSPIGRANAIGAYNSLLPLLKRPECRLHMVGTVWAYGDLSFYLKEHANLPTFRRTVYDGVNPKSGEKDGQGPLKGGGWALAPSTGYTDQYLIEMQTKGHPHYIDPAWWAAQYELRPRADEAALFDEELIELATDDRLDSLEAGYEVAMVDPAAKAEKWHDHNGIVVYRVVRHRDIGEIPHDRLLFYPVYADRFAGGLLALERRLLSLVANRPRLKAIFGEDQGFQAGMFSFLERDGWGDVRFYPVKIGKTTKNYRAFQLHTGVAKKIIRLPRSFEGRDLLVNDLIAFPTVDYMDLIDAAGLVTMLRQDAEPVPQPAPSAPKYSVQWHRETEARHAEANSAEEIAWPT